MPRGRSRSRRLALVAAPVVTVLAVGAGMAAGDLEQQVSPAAAQGSLTAATGALAAVPPTKQPAAERTLGSSRSGDRVPLVNHRVPDVTDRLWTTADLELRLEPREHTRSLGLLDALKRVGVTGKRRAGYAEVVIDGKPRWVTAKYLASKKPKPPTGGSSSGGSSSGGSSGGGISSAPCPDGSSIEAALQPSAVKVYRAVCAAFPELTTYGGQDGHGEHVNGQAIDFMVPSHDLGERVKNFLYANRSAFNLFDIIWSQQIWTIERAGEGFRGMSDRGSATANHFDHVHIKVN